MPDTGLRSAQSFVERTPRLVVGRRAGGFSLLELIVAVTILSILTGAAIPLVQTTVRRERESQLREALREMRRAIDAYKRYTELTNGVTIPIEFRTPSGYPKELKLLVEGFIPANTVGTSGNRIRFLRRLPVDPMTGGSDWGLRSYKDKPDATTWGTEDVFDVYSKSGGKALNGSYYKDW
jgi:general secretion pathway protein G